MADDELWRIVTGSHSGILATTNADGSPQLSNIYYLSDAEDRVIRFSTTTERVKGRNLLRDPRASLHVAGKNFLNFAVASGDASVAVATHPNSTAVKQLFAIHEALGARPDQEGFGEEMVAAARMAVTLNVTRLYGQLLDREPLRAGGETERHD